MSTIYDNHPILGQKIEFLNLPKHIERRLKAHNIKYIAVLITKSVAELFYNILDIDTWMFNKIKEALEKYNLSLNTKIIPALGKVESLEDRVFILEQVLEKLLPIIRR